MKKQNGIRAVLWTVLMLAAALTGCCADGENVCTLDPADPARFTCGGVEYITLREAVPRDAVGRKLGDIQTLAAVDGEGRVVDTCGVTLSFSALTRLEERLPEGGRTVQVLNVWALPGTTDGAVAVMVDGTFRRAVPADVLPPEAEVLSFARQAGGYGEAFAVMPEDCRRLMGFCSSSVPPIALSEDDDAAIYFSSGTTGFPKAILHRHKALVCSCMTEQHHHGQTKDDVFLCIPPLYHTGAKMHWFGSLISGSKAVLLRGVKPEWILRTITEEKCTIVWLLVPWAQDILDAIESGRVNLDHYLLDQWRLMHIGAQPVPPSLIKRWLKYFPHHKYDTNYGLSESIGPGCVHLGVDNIEKIGAIGKAGYLWQTRIIDEQGQDVAPGAIGELAVKGPGVMKCYYKNPEATAEILHGDWLWTGDMAREDEDGFIYLVDRKKDVIISGGENLYPVQIEDFLRRCGKIKDVAVIGLPDQRLGEIAAAIIELKDGVSCTEAEIQDFCRELPRYKRPRRVIFAKVPRNPTGKIEKPVLRQIYCGGRLVEEQTKA